MTRNQITNGILDSLARSLAEDVELHFLSEREVHMIAANLADEAIHYAMKYRAEEKAEALRNAREERRAGA